MMIFEVDLQSGKPVYQQLIDQVKYAVATGRLKAGDRLPSIRDVAVAVRVNRNTVARVYSELEREGVIYSRTGQGSFIADRDSPLSESEQRRLLIEPLDDLLAQAKLFGLARDEVETVLRERLDAVFAPQQAAPQQAAAGKPDTSRSKNPNSKKTGRKKTS